MLTANQAPDSVQAALWCRGGQHQVCKALIAMRGACACREGTGLSDEEW